MKGIIENMKELIQMVIKIKEFIKLKKGINQQVIEMKKIIKI